VTLSDQAQQILDGAAPPPADDTPPAANAPDAAAAPQTPTNDQVDAAVAALNDTSGKTSLDDQIKAYDLIGTLVAKGQVVTGKTLLNVNPSPAATSVGVITSDQATALIGSTFAQRVNQVTAKVDGAKATGSDPDSAVQAGLTAFNALSADDQQVYLAATNLNNGLLGGQPPVATADDYRAAQQALVDNGTAPPPPPAAKTAPAGYTPPAVGALMDALAKLDDTSGAVPVDQQTAALKLLTGYQAAAPQGLAASLVIQNAQASPFALRAAHDQTFVETDVVPGDDVYEQMLDHLNILSPDDQQAYYGQVATAADGSTLYASLSSLKQNLSTRDDLQTIYAKVTKAYGVGSLSDLTGAPARNPALQKLQTLMGMDQGNDNWTKLATDFINSTSPADLGLVSDDGDPDAEKALKTLKEVADVQHKFVLAIKAGKASQWNATAETKQVKDKDAADDLMGQVVNTKA
jgi:hypothetical protein